jgi:hypothetical protein
MTDKSSSQSRRPIGGAAAEMVVKPPFLISVTESVLAARRAVLHCLKTLPSMLALLSAMLEGAVSVCWSCTVSAGAVVMSTSIAVLGIAANIVKHIKELYCTVVFIVVPIIAVDGVKNIGTGTDSFGTGTGVGIGTGTGTGNFGTGTGPGPPANIVIQTVCAINIKLKLNLENFFEVQPRTGNYFSKIVAHLCHCKNFVNNKIF